jgi:hypothetical protein
VNPLFPEQDQASARLGTQKRDAAMAQVEAHASVSWSGSVEQAIYYVAQHRQLFTTDAVWAVLRSWDIVAPAEPRAMGPLMKNACRWGWCVPTGDHWMSVRPECHRRPIAVYRSLVQR